MATEYRFRIRDTDTNTETIHHIELDELNQHPLKQAARDTAHQHVTLEYRYAPDGHWMEMPS